MPSQWVDISEIHMPEFSCFVKMDYILVPLYDCAAFLCNFIITVKIILEGISFLTSFFKPSVWSLNPNKQGHEDLTCRHTFFRLLLVKNVFNCYINIYIIWVSCQQGPFERFHFSSLFHLQCCLIKPGWVSVFENFCESKCLIKNMLVLCITLKQSQVDLQWKHKVNVIL